MDKRKVSKILLCVIKNIKWIIEKKEIISYLFLFGLLLLTYLNFGKLPYSIWISQYITHITILTVLFGSITFWRNREKVEKEIEEEKNNEELIEQKRKEEFPTKFPRINKIPVLRSFVRWMYKEGWFYGGILITSIICFILTRLPFLNQEFIDKHIQKYAATLEPVRTMLETNNPFIIQRMYQSNPVTNPYGIFTTLSNIPLLEWILFFFSRIFSFLDFTFVIRSTMTLLAVIMLVSTFYLGKKIFSKKFGLLLVLFVFSNYIFNLIYHVTVYDGLLFIVFNILIIYVLQNRTWERIAVTGLISGFIAGVKYSFLIYIYPIISLLIFLNKDIKIKERIFNFLSYSFFIIIIPLINIISDYFKISLLNKCLIIILLFLAIPLYFKIKPSLYYLFDKIKIKYYIYILALGIPSTFYIFVYKLKIATPEIFLTDREIIFNKNLYLQIFDWLQGFIPFNIIYIIIIFFIISIFDLIIYKDKYPRINILIVGIITTSLLYLIIASKTIFFHAYYLFFFIYVLYFIITYIILRISLNYKKHFGFLLISLILFLSFSNQYQQTNKLLSQTKDDLVVLSNYINNNFDKTENIYINSSELSVLSLYTNRKTFEYYRLTTDINIKKTIMIDGLSNFFEKYKIKHYVSDGEIKLHELGLIMTQLPINEITRTDQILLRTGVKNFENVSSYKEIVLEGEKVFADHFTLKEVIGRYSIYSIY
ncbi:MAG TPA: glycosyltransferase family 39 protein [Candidatus Paceibacterota bacterium]|nr:glycosyltransferase family 39 protein [Candidatus Paceibacterota bacterium]